MALLDGVPGAGKTEVYLEAVAEALRAGRRVLVLLPEIALSAQWLGRFERRFGAAPAVWHSGLTCDAAAAHLAADRRGCHRRRRRRALRPVPAADRSRPDRRRRGARRQLQAGGDRSTTTRATRRWSVRGSRAAPRVLASATPSLESAVAAGIVRGGPEARPGWPMWRCRRAMAVRPCPRSASSTSVATGRRAAASSPRPARGAASQPRRGRPVAAVPQPPRLRPAHPVPRLRPSPRLPELLGLAGRRIGCAAGCSAIIAATP